MGILFNEPGRIYEKLPSEDKERLKIFLNKYSSPPFESLEPFYCNHIISDIVSYNILSNDELFFIGTILLKSISYHPGSFFLTPDFFIFVNLLTSKIETPITDLEWEIQRVKLICSHLKSPKSLGPTIASYIAYPLLEAILKKISPHLKEDGTVIDTPIIRRNQRFINRSRITNLENILLISEITMSDRMRNLLVSLDEENGLYSTIKKHRDNLLHGKTSHDWDSFRIVLIILLLYVPE